MAQGKESPNSDNTADTVFFYPLDVIGNWNKLYGKWVPTVPMRDTKFDGIANMRKLLTKIAESGDASFLAVLKQFGEANDNLLSFPTEGYTLALDFKLTTSARETLRTLEEIVAGMEGILDKDAVMQEATFKATYPNWEAFESKSEKNMGLLANLVLHNQKIRFGMKRVLIIGATSAIAEQCARIWATRGDRIC